MTEQKIGRIAAGARAAIRMHAKTGNVDFLRKDLRNGRTMFLEITEIVMKNSVAAREHQEKLTVKRS